jgi:uncharacterized surface protein with fasciclin (FAS1) repeats
MGLFAVLFAAVPCLADCGTCDKTVVEVAVGSNDFETLVAAVKAAGLVDTLSGEGPFTVFAPTDEAFGKLPKDTVEELVKPENKEKLTAILTYHVVPGRVMAADVVKLKEAKTVQGSKAKIKVADGKVKIDNATVVKTDIVCKNGVIHVIDRVLLPPEKLTRQAACREVVRRAIHRGVPMYNSGNHAACAAIYEVAAMSLISLAGDDMPEETRDLLAKSVEKAQDSHHAGQRAWILRHGIDAVYAAMSMEP